MRRPSKKKATKAKKPAKAKGAIKAKPRSKTTKKAVENWSPSKFALRSERWSTNNASTSVLLRHPTAPFPPEGLLVDAIDDKTMQELGLNYLLAVSQNQNIDPPLNLPPSWIDALQKPGSNPAFAWLPLGWPPKDSNDSNAGDPFVSFQAQRFAADGKLLPDRTVILLASEWAQFNVGGQIVNRVLGSDFGIRVVAHAWQMRNGAFQVRITGVTATLPYGRYIDHSISTSGPADVLSPFLEALTKNTFAEIKANLAAKTGLKRESFSLRGVRLAQDVQRVEGRWTAVVRAEWRATSKPSRGNYTASTPVAAVFMETGPTLGSDQNEVTLVSTVELVADQSPGEAFVFPIDPASQNGMTALHERRPSRVDPLLNPFRYRQDITGYPLEYLAFPLPTPPPAPPPPPTAEVMEVITCPGFVVTDNPRPDQIEIADLPAPSLDHPRARSNAFAAVSAFKNVTEFFDRLNAYGLGVAPYFRIATTPLRVFYRSGVRPGPGKDGQTVNARVMVEGWNPDFVGPTPLGERPVLAVHLALADLWTRGRHIWNPRDPRRSQAEPLGIAADARWIWHEIGHVLLMCSVGELEFRFAHSAGDSLAAIACDPQSALADDDNWRGATFPWVFTPRRHDRCVLCGWGWVGTLHYDMSVVPYATLPRRKGYWTEQILSSSLFRFYRSIGGDTIPVGPPAAAGGPGETTRQSASHYSVYLIMRAIQIMGTSGVMLANEPDQFVSALIDADIGTGNWTVNWTLPFDVLYQPPVANVAFAFDRVGGCVWKVIRWAFEAQGLYGLEGTIANAPGLPPPADVYIPDLRPTVESTRYGDIDYGQGAYVPVSLDFDPAQTGAGPAPAWQTDPLAGIVVAGGAVTVTVGNRGTEPATGVVVGVWWIAWAAAAPAPDWNAAGWTAIAPSAAQTIAPGAVANFGPFPFAPAAGTRYLVFAQATCPGDPANSDPSTGLPCSALDTPLVDLVANDNNLGLVVIGP